MQESLKIYVDRLKNGEEETITAKLDPSLFDLKKEDDVSAKEPIQVSGKAYIAGDFLIVELDIDTTLTLRCSVCNRAFSFAIHLKQWIHEEPLEDIKHGIFEYGVVVREACLLEIPLYPQCGVSLCLHRDEIEKYLKKPSEDSSKQEDKSSHYYPFADL